jgi:hypothetical protein
VLLGTVKVPVQLVHLFAQPRGEFALILLSLASIIQSLFEREDVIVDFCLSEGIHLGVPRRDGSP